MLFLAEPADVGASERLLGQKDGSMLETLKRLDGGTIHLPSRPKDRPDRDRLALRSKRFRAVALKITQRGNGMELGFHASTSSQ